MVAARLGAGECGAEYGEDQDSLIRTESSLIARFHSL